MSSMKHEERVTGPRETRFPRNWGAPLLLSCVCCALLLVFVFPRDVRAENEFDEFQIETWTTKDFNVPLRIDVRTPETIATQKRNRASGMMRAFWETPPETDSNVRVTSIQQTTSVDPSDASVTESRIDTGRKAGRDVPGTVGVADQQFDNREQFDEVTTGSVEEQSHIQWTESPQRRWWGHAELLMSWIKGSSLPPLLTSNPLGTPGSVVGLLDEPSTSVLFGGNQVGRFATGGRWTVGRWLNAHTQSDGMELEASVLGGSREFLADGDNGIIARPFFNTSPSVNRPDVQIVSMPGLVDGTMEFGAGSLIVSAAPRWRRHVQSNCDCGKCRGDRVTCSRYSRLDVLAGYRYLRARERLWADETLHPVGGLFAAGSSIELRDRIRSTNDFHGLEMGLSRSSRRNRWSIEWMGTMAIGQVFEQSLLNGTTTATIPGIFSSTIPGGFLVRPENIGRWKRRDFAWLPQTRLALAFRVRPNLHLDVGYDVLYLSSVIRPDDLASTEFDSDTLATLPAAVGTTAPTAEFGGIWTQGIRFGLTWRR